MTYRQPAFSVEVLSGRPLLLHLVSDKPGVYAGYMPLRVPRSESWRLCEDETLMTNTETLEFPPCTKGSAYAHAACLTAIDDVDMLSVLTGGALHARVPVMRGIGLVFPIGSLVLEAAIVTTDLRYQ